MAIDIGISKSDREGVAEHLSRVLADTYSLYLKTHGFHWNVTGPMFMGLHAMLEDQYQEMWAAADIISERIRTLDIYALGSYPQFGKLTSLKQETGVPDWKEMVSQLVDGHETAARTGREAVKVAAAANDQATADLVTATPECARESRVDAALATQIAARRRCESSRGFATGDCPAAVPAGRRTAIRPQSRATA